MMFVDMRDTNFEAIDKEGADKIISSLPSFSTTTTIVDSNYILDNQPTELKERPESTYSTLENDFVTSRSNIRGLTEHGPSIISNLIELCKNSDSPRAFEVLGQMIDRFAVLEEKLIDLHIKKTKAVSNGKDAAQPVINVNNNQYNKQMSTKELLESIQGDEIDE